jgi:hypothetical protein
MILIGLDGKDCAFSAPWAEAAAKDNRLKAAMTVARIFMKVSL